MALAPLCNSLPHMHMHMHMLSRRNWESGTRPSALPCVASFLIFLYSSSCTKTIHIHARLLVLALGLVAIFPATAQGLGYMSSIAVSYGDPGFVCAIKASDQQKVSCWGRNASSVGGQFEGPQNIGFAGLSGGRGFMCGLMANSYQPYCWSANQTGLNTVPSAYWNVAYASIAAGDTHVCAVQAVSGATPGKVDCWGSNFCGESLPPPTLFTSLVAGHQFTCGISGVEQTAVCWGNSTTSLPQGYQGQAFQRLASGAYHVCGIVLGSGLPWCWGDNTKKQAQPPAVKFAVLAGGLYHTCGVREDTHEVQCWGDGYNVSSAMPAVSGFLAITGGQVSCGVSEQNLIAACWGNGTDYAPPLQLFSPGICGADPCRNGEFYFNASAIGVTTSLCADPSQRICSPCSLACPKGSFVSGRCTADSDLQCAPCSQCQNQICQAACAGGQSSSPPVYSPASLTGQPEMNLRVPARKKPLGLSVIIGVATGGGILIFFVATAVVFCIAWRRRGRYLMFACGSDSEMAGQNGLMHAPSSLSSSLGSSGVSRRGTHDFVIRTQAFRLTELRDATNGFKEVNELGRGNYGFVYKATLADGRQVAVKRANAARRIQSNSRDFETELEILCKLHHANLVNLLGYCEEMGERLLVYEFMPHGTLHDHLHGGLSVLSWGLRVKISLQAARGIEYLHKDASPRIVHRDVKSSNILLDCEWGAHVADFGLVLPGSEKIAPVAAPPAADIGYMDPEYLQTQIFTEKSDVYSFGVVLLEVLSGRKVYDSEFAPAHIVEWAVPYIQQGKTVTILDRSLELPKNVEGLLRTAEIAEMCVRATSAERPCMSDVAGWLEQVARGSSQL